MVYILKIYSHPRSPLKGFKVIESDNWPKECETERALDYKSGCSSMSQHDSKAEAIDQARRILPASLFNKCF